MSRPTYQQVHTDVPLTRISVAYAPGQYIAEKIFPAIPVEKISGKYFIYTKADWLRSDAAVRAPGAKAARGDYGVSTSLYTCIEYAIAKGVPDEIVANSDNPLKPLEDATRWTTEQVLLKQEKDVAGQVFGSSIWSGSATPSTLWSNDTSDPIGDIETAANSVVSTIGLEPNRGAVGRGLWRYLKNHPDVVDRIKYSAGPTSPAIVTLKAVAALAGLDDIFVGTAIEDTAQEGAAASIAYVWGSHFAVCYVTGNAALLSPSAGYVFNYQAREVSRFREEQNRQDVVETRQAWDTVVVSPDSGYLIKSAA